MKKTTLAIVWLALSGSPLAMAECQVERQLLPLQQQWAHIQYEVPTDQKASSFSALSEQAQTLVSQCPGRAEPLIWRGIILSTYAGVEGGLGALSLVKEARASLEEAIALDERALDGSAHTSLGSLYYQVPGWPLSFGDDDQAEAHLKAALALNPDGIDANYFYADYLIDQGEEAQARTYLQHALEAKSRPGRELADRGRREEVRHLLAQIH